MSDSSNSSEDLQHRQDEEDGWEDVEPDVEQQNFKSLFEDKWFGDIRDLIRYDKEHHDFDFIKLRKQLKLDYLDCIRLINYARSETQQGRHRPRVWTASLFDDEHYLKPTMEDDALLYSLDDIEEPASEHVTASADDREQEVRDLRDRLAQLQMQFSAYREEVKVSFQDHLDSIKEDPHGSANARLGSISTKHQDQESGYFNSYSFNSIHEFMLKDTIRTDAYRDFIYTNKHLFQGKTVLDVGCGTGILSLFCAKAGAKQVLAVDNSSIIDKARVIVYENGFGDVIKCLRGKMEEVYLPVDKVDVIVSEWMGYGLLYESMLDSVLWARDRYLTHGDGGHDDGDRGNVGLMVPSHATLRLAPLISSDVRIDHVDFWKSVYGFDMSCMLDKSFDEALVRSVDKSDIPPPGSNSTASFLELDLHTTKLCDLDQFKPFQIPWPSSSPNSITTATSTVPPLSNQPYTQSLDGFLIWFDISFSTNPFGSNSNPGSSTRFSTSPYSPPTHWQQVVLLSATQDFSWQAGDIISGEIRYQKKEPEGRDRSVDIEIVWGKGEGKEVQRGRQVWSLD